MNDTNPSSSAFEITVDDLVVVLENADTPLPWEECEALFAEHIQPKAKEIAHYALSGPAESDDDDELLAQTKAAHQKIKEILEEAGVLIKTVPCKFCGREVPEKTAHLHEGAWVGDECCWDERLRTTA
jgi:hypothetical protein